jgi:hypothetical protein
MTGADEVMATTPVTDEDGRHASLRALVRLASAAPERS